MSNQLVQAIQRHGHDVEFITRPFRFQSYAAIRKEMNSWAQDDFSQFDCGSIDLVISLKFPTYYLQHSNKIIWLMHQHRSVYELFNTKYGESDKAPDAAEFKNEVVRRDTRALKTARELFTISKRVSERMFFYNGVASIPIHQPPAHEELFYCAEQLDYIFFPSRLETLKRQELLIRALARCRAPVAAIIAGEGGGRDELKRLTHDLQLEDRVRFIGRVSDREMRAWYANALGVFFGPYDEDYGFVTLEAMLSAKPVITCTDSGGPLDFVVNGETGWVVAPNPDPVADAIEVLYANKANAKKMGAAGLGRYRTLDITWDRVVERLVK